MDDAATLQLQPNVSYLDYFQDDDAYHQLSPEFQFSFFLLYGISIFLSVTGNVVVVIVFSCGRKSRTELAPFLINLAISDLIVAIFCMPFTSTQNLLGKWIYPHFLCPAVTFMQHTSVSASIYTQTFISIDRLRSIYRPLRTRRSKTNYQLLIILGFIWLWATLLGSVQFFVIKVTPQDPFWMQRNDSLPVYLCLEQWPPTALDGSSIYSQSYTVCVLLIDYIIPLLCIGCAYCYVGRKLWERTTPGEASDVRDKYQLQSKRKVIKMLALMVLSFGVLWLPLHAFFVLHEFSNFLTDLPPKYFNTLFVACHFFAMMSVIVNIVIYVLVNKNFKSDFHHLITRKCLKHLPHSESHRQAVALRRTPAFHGYPPYHYRRALDGTYSKDNSNSSPMLPFSRPLSTPYDTRMGLRAPYRHVTANHALPVGLAASFQAGHRSLRSPRSLPNMHPSMTNKRSTPANLSHNSDV